MTDRKTTDVTLPGGATYHVFDHAMIDADSIAEHKDMVAATNWLILEVEADIESHHDIVLGGRQALCAAIVGACSAAVAKMFDDGEIVVPEGWDVR